MATELPDFGEMLGKIASNPIARDMLASFLGGGEHKEEPQIVEEEPFPSEASSPDDTVIPAMARHLPPRRKGHARHDLLCALRPYLGKRRGAALERILHALELYEMIEEMSPGKGGH